MVRGLRFVWDRAKAEANLRNHGVNFEVGISLFADPEELMLDDPDHSITEKRLGSIGRAGTGELMPPTGGKVNGMREEYDFTNAVRGRYAEGVEVGLEEPSGIDAWQEKPDVVRLDPDMRAVFRDSQAVNDALLVLIKTAENLISIRKAS